VEAVENILQLSLDEAPLPDEGQQTASFNLNSEPAQFQPTNSGSVSSKCSTKMGMCLSCQGLAASTTKDTVLYSEKGDGHEAEMLAAKRSLITNIVFLSLAVVINVGLLFVDDNVRPFFTAIILSVLKGALPVFMTITNFGTVQFVVVQYWQHLKTINFC
jgi:hypothetical protein